MSPNALDYRLRWEYTGVTGLGEVDKIFRDELESMARDVGEHVVQTCQDYIYDRPNGELFFTGDLLGSITYGVEWLNTYDILTNVGTNLNYGRWQELGTRPHFVPFAIAPSLYDELQRKWGWVKPTGREAERLAGIPLSGETIRPGLRITTGRSQTYANMGRLWLKRTPNSRPMWGVRVSGEPRPFIQPGWSQSVAFIEERIAECGRRVEQRVRGVAA
jgi:hypothetical protein